MDPECDFTEYCNGTSSNCVPDTYAMNGQLCRSGTAYCYSGRCQTTDNQCAKVFGKGTALFLYISLFLVFDEAVKINNFIKPQFLGTYLLNILHDPWGGYLKHSYTRGHSKALLQLVDL